MKRALLCASLLFAGVCRRGRCRTGRPTAVTPPRHVTPRSRRSIAATSSRLALAWSFDTAEKGDTQTQPIVVGRTLFGYTPSHKAFALDAATGKQLWTFDSGIAGVGANRGLMYWSRRHGRARVRRGRQLRLRAECRPPASPSRPSAETDASTCAKISGAIRRRSRCASRRPASIYRDLMIVGGRVGESLPASPGHVRAYDVRTGALRWSFHTIPAAGRTRPRNLAQGRVEIHRRREQLARHDAR